jgi:hypothetical protein
MITQTLTTRRAVALALAAFAVTFALLGIGAAGMAYAQGARGVCATEDSTACVWVGPLQGNHGGRIVVNGPDSL